MTNGVWVGKMDFAGYTVQAIGKSKKEVQDAIKKSVTSSVYWKDSEWNGRSWTSAWEYFAGHSEFMFFGKAEWH